MQESQRSAAIKVDGLGQLEGILAGETFEDYFKIAQFWSGKVIAFRKDNQKENFPIGIDGDESPTRSFFLQAREDLLQRDVGSALEDEGFGGVGIRQPISQLDLTVISPNKTVEKF